MTKRDYQAIAGALYRATRPEDPRVYERRGETVARVVSALADVLAADNPRFDRDTFVAACEDGNVGRRPKRPETPAQYAKRLNRIARDIQNAGDPREGA